MTYSIISFFYLAGIIQGITMSFALIIKKYLTDISNKILLLLVISIVLLLAHFLLLINEIYIVPVEIRPAAVAIWFGLSPLFYLYVQSLIKSNFRLKIVHLPMFIFSLYNLSHVLFGLLGFKFGFYQLFTNWAWYGYVWLFAYLAHAILFSSLIIYDLKKLKLKQFDWLKVYFTVFLTIMSIATIYLMIVSNSDEFFEIIEISFVLIFGFFVLILAVKSMSPDHQIASRENKTKYSNSDLTDERLEKMKHSLHMLMESKKPYLDKDLKLSSLAEITGIKENDLSQLLNIYLNSGFYEYLRGYRLLEVEYRIKDPKYHNLKITSIAEDAGFRSKAAFYKAFKEKHGITPSEYLKRSN